MDQLAEAYRGRRVLLTGHTGFKGAWLSEWLLMLGAEVQGYSLPPPTSPALFEQLGLAERLSHKVADVRDGRALAVVIRDFQPDYVFHLAAQPLVRQSYAEPADTFAINVQGTVNVLESLRGQRHPCAAVLVTTDKCYANPSRAGGCQEEDPLGGEDPYSASKAAAELAIAAWRSSFFASVRADQTGQVGIASARAGNVIGGGDWAADRIVPDCIRRLTGGETVFVRNPDSVRPWQHVLEPLSGYLLLGSRLRTALVTGQSHENLAAAFNFGPDDSVDRSVRELVEEVLRHWPGKWARVGEADAPRESPQLRLDSRRAAAVLGWRGHWNFAEAVAHTVSWYRSVVENPASAAEVTRRQIQSYMDRATYLL